MTGFTFCGWVSASGASVPSSAELRAAHPGPAAMLHTCQRSEVYHLSNCDCTPASRLAGLGALRHLAEVAAGLHSVVLGEEQILGQVRDAWASAEGRFGHLGAIAIGAARRVRDRNDLRADTGWLLDRALTTAGVPAQGSILVIGTGVLARRVIARARDLGFERLTMAGRTTPPGLPDGTAWVPLPELAAGPPADVVVGCLGYGAPRIDPAAGLPPVARLIVDLGTPGNFEGSASVPVVAIADLLDEAAMANDPRRAALRAELHQVLDERLRPAVGTASRPIGQLRGHVESIRQAEAARILRLHPELPPETIDVITRSLINRVFHTPSERLRALDDAQLGERVAALFAPEEAL